MNELPRESDTHALLSVLAGAVGGSTHPDVTFAEMLAELADDPDLMPTVLEALVRDANPD